MVAVFQLWDLKSGNLVDQFATETDALAVVREAADQHGEAEVAALALAREAGNGPAPIAEGPALLLRAIGMADLASGGLKRSSQNRGVFRALLPVEAERLPSG